MSAFNMLNRVPYNVTVPEFQPERRSPIFPQITRKYPCIENIANLQFMDRRAISRLTWKIQQPDPTLVFTGVKIVLPLRMQSYTTGDDQPLDMRVTSRKPAANIALAETPMMAFGQTSLTINGRVFSEDNSFRRILDACYRGSSPAAYGDNHSLKPVVIRNMDNDNSRQVTRVLDATTGAPAVDGDSGNPLIIEQNYVAGKALDSAFSLLEHNGPFLERARKFQDNLSEDGLTWTDDVTSYLEVGPFQARARRGNTAVPYIRDLHLMLNFIGGESRLDRDLGTNVMQSRVVGLRALPARLFEFGTPANLRHPGEKINALLGWLGFMVCTWRQKPYLEVTYTKYIEAMKPSYGLRCYERQYEKSNAFALVPSARGSETKLARVTSRVLSMPTKIYVYGELTDVQKGAWINGGVRRSCRLENLHCRINQRPNVIFNPSQEACYEMFQRHTNSSLEYASWLKSPIYVFTPVDLAQPDMFANDARRTIIEWDAEVSMTALQGQEESDATNPSFAMAVGYEASAVYNHIFDVGGDFDVEARWNVLQGKEIVSRSDEYQLEFIQQMDATVGERRLNYDFRKDGQEALWQEFLAQKIVKFTQDPGGNPCPLTEDAKLVSTRRSWQGGRGLLWAKIQAEAGSEASLGKVLNGEFFYVPFTSEFIARDTPDRRTQVNTWSLVTEYATAANDENGDPIYTAKVDIDDPEWRWWRGSLLGDAKNVMNGGDATNGTLQSGEQSWKKAIPGPYAYLCDRTGLRNQGTTQAAYASPGLLRVGDAPYTVIDQTASQYRWAAFALSDGMVNETGLDHHFVVSRAKTDPSTLPNNSRGVTPDDKFAEVPLGFNYGNLTGHGQLTLSQIWQVERGVHFRKTQGTHSMQSVALHSRGYPLTHESINAASRIASVSRNYQLKVLYEFGNAQYQFSADAMPTKVLPNLVPVGPSAGIPYIK